MDRVLYFFIGTEAELMKVFPAIVAAKSRGYLCKTIANGQNDCHRSPFLNLIHEDKISLDICEELPKSKGTLQYVFWMLRTARHGIRKINDFIKTMPNSEHLMVVHGDTLSTAMGAWLAQKCNMPYVHIESGLRSHNFLSPFPEELDRLYGSRHSVINFCPGKTYTEYAGKHFKGKAVNTIYNTGIETLQYFMNENKGKVHSQMPNEPYFMFMMHRQENLMNKTFVSNAVRHIVELSKKIRCVYIYHQQTRDAMEKYGAYDLIANCPTVTTLPRQNYGEFLLLVDHSQFVISDGCGNQQEFYYLGKPYLIMRTAVEKNSEGLNHNAFVFNNDFSNIERFYSRYANYIKPPILPETLPSTIILDELDQYFSKE